MKIDKRIIWTVLAVLIALAIIMPQHGNIKHDIGWRSTNLQIWHEAAKRFVKSNGRLPSHLHEVYVNSFDWLKSQDFSTRIRMLTSGKKEEMMKNNSHVFEDEAQYRLVVFDENRWYIMEHSSDPKEEKSMLMIDQDGIVWKANRKAVPNIR